MLKLLLLLITVLAILGTATKLKNTKKISLTGVVSGNADFDGSKDIIINTEQTNIAVITGNITLAANTNDYAVENRCTMTDVSLSYPSGYSMNNCVVLCVGINYNSQGYYDFGWANYLSTLQFARGLLPNEVLLKDTAINLSIGNLMTSEKTVNYKIVLMKIS